MRSTDVEAPTKGVRGADKGQKVPNDATFTAMLPSGSEHANSAVR